MYSNLQRSLYPLCGRHGDHTLNGAGDHTRQDAPRRSEPALFVGEDVLDGVVRHEADAGLEGGTHSQRGATRVDCAHALLPGDQRDESERVGHFSPRVEELPSGLGKFEWVLWKYISMKMVNPWKMSGVDVL